MRGKRVLVVHPFDATIKSQYARRKELFANGDILPDNMERPTNFRQHEGGAYW